MEGGSSSRERTETSGSTSSARDPLATVLSAINSSQVEMRKLREEMRAAQEETAARQPSKKKERPYQFNKKGHEDQFQFNDGVVDRMDEAESHLARAARNLADGPAKDAVEKAREAVREGKNQLAHRQKLIKLADRSELGWHVVNEYETDVLADNPEDERRLENAEKAAERKVLAKARKLDAAAKLKKGFGGREKPEPGQGVVTAVPVPKPQVAPVARPSGPLVCYSCGEDADVLLSRKGLSHDEVCFDGVWSREMDEGRNWEFQAGDGELLEAVSELVNGHFVEEVQEPTYICSPLSVVENSSGKKRLVVNLRHVNQFLCKRRFKYEDLRIAMMLFSPGELMFNFDLKSRYHHVEIAGHHRKYLGFEWDQHFYVFAVLPFGLASAPYLFTKLLRPLVRLWRSKGLKAVMYLDDGIVAVQGEKEAEKASGWVRNTLHKSGLVVNDKKSVWRPSHSIAWLGFEIDLLKGQIAVPQAKVQALQSMLKGALCSQRLQARCIASIVGKIISMGIAVGPVSRFMTRNLYALLDCRKAWCEMLELTPPVRMELDFWANCLPKYNAQPLWHTPSAVRVVYSDASDTGYGGYTVEHGTHVAQGVWTAEEASQSSTWRELVAVSRVLNSIATKLCNTRVRWFSDNQNVIRILQVGSRKPNLQEQALKVFETCIIHQIRLEPEWIPRAQNELADFISRIVDYDDWQISPELFYYLEEAWGPYSLDRFADNFNTQLSRFNSRFACPGSEAVDTFTVHWGGGENNWWCPPPSLVARVVRHAETCKANGTLVVPHWESAPYWPLLCPDGMMFASFVGASEVLPGEIIPGRSGGVMILSTRGHDLLISGSGILAAGVWPLMSNLEDPKLQRLAAALPDTVLMGKADSTTKKYLGTFRRWKLWAEARQGVPSFPAQDTHIALYLQHLSESVESTSAIEEAVNALSWLHQAAGLQPVSGAPLVQAALAGFRRILAKPRVRKEPETAEMLKSMVDSAGPDPSLSEVRLLAVCLLAFAAMLERYFHMGGLCSGSHDKVFRAIVNTKSGETLRLNALWNPCGWCSCDMFIFRTCASRVLHSLSTALCIYYIWLTFILAKQNNGTSDVEGPEEGDSLSDVVGPEEGDGPSDGEGPEEGDGPSDVVGPEEGDGPSDVEGPEEDDGLQMLKGQKMMMDFRCGRVRRSEQERDGGGRQRVLVCLFLTLILSCVEVEDVLFPLGRGTVLLHSVEVGMMAAEGGGEEVGACFTSSRRNNHKCDLLTCTGHEHMGQLFIDKVSTTVHDMLLLLYDWHSNLGCHDTSDFQRLGNSGNLHVSPGVTLLHFMLSHQVMAKLTKAGITPFSHFASHILTWGAASVINQPDPSEKWPIHHAYQVAKTLGISRWESMVSPFVEHGAHRDAVDHSGACVPFHPATLMCLSCLAAKKIVCAGIPYRTLTILPSHIKEFIAFHDPS
eukprot:Em0004g869a